MKTDLAVFEIHEGLHDGVVGGVHVLVERKGAFAEAVIRLVSLRRDDPVLFKMNSEVSRDVAAEAL